MQIALGERSNQQ